MRKKVKVGINELFDAIELIATVILVELFLVEKKKITIEF